MTTPASFWSPRPMPRRRHYTVDNRLMLLYYRSWSLSLTLGWPMLHRAMDEIDWMLRPRWDR